VYNGLRPWLPLIAALAANAPFHEGRDTGMASIRPQIATLLPRQGIPPALPSWEVFSAALAWSAAAGAVPDPRRWWWELRPHPAFGTLELRVPDAQTTVEDAAAVAALAHTLVAWLAARHDAGERLETAATWRLEENRWSAARWGMDAELADLATGARVPARERLGALVAELAPVAQELGCGAELASVELLAAANGAVRQREVAAAAGGDAHALTGWLADMYVPSADYALAAPGT
jgi:carboxylate-amine ligase